MSGSKIPGNAGGEVVRNSALSFVACAQPASPGAGGDGGGGGGGQQGGSSTQDDREATQPERTSPVVPAGLKALCEAYSRLYPDQPNPLQVTTRLKYWLGGHDPLDYISMYWNPGKPDENIPPHWHYVSFGLSDLHGDGRVHAPPDRVLLRAAAAGGGAAGAGGAPASPPLPPSGFGLELTFRLEAPAPPPLWPAALLQALARYLFTTGNKFVPGDHISWHCALDGSGGGGGGGGGGGEGASRVRHLLVAEDPQLRAVSTPHGAVSFIQLVGCTGRELRAAQRGSGFDVLKLMAEDPNCGGSWLVTRMRRRSSARRVRAAGAAGGAGVATLAGVSARMRWEPWTPSPEEDASPVLSLSVERQIKETLQRGLSTMSTDRTGPEGHTGMSTDSFEMSSIERALPQIPELMQGSWRSGAGGSRAEGEGEGEEGVEGVCALRGVHVVVGAEGGALLPLALRGRVLHGAHFTWRCPAPAPLPAALTLLAPGVTGALATLDRPYVAKGLWLQMMITPELAEEMLQKVSHLTRLGETDSETDSESEGDNNTPTTLPQTFAWPKHRLKISVVPDHQLL